MSAAAVTWLHGKAFMCYTIDRGVRLTLLHWFLVVQEGQVDIIYLDMSKAFDKVSHHKLLTLLQQRGFGGNLLVWFDSYLHNGIQRVTTLGLSSKALLVFSRVP